MAFPSDFYRFLKNHTLVFVKGGNGDHAFLDIWMVVVDGRVFARSWTRKERSWFTAFRESGEGQIRYGEKVIGVKGTQLPADSPLQKRIDRAYLRRFTDPESREYAVGIARPEFYDYTMEFLF